MNEMKTKIKDQEKKINHLVKQNNEFKNSVITLYNELEKFKEREKSSNHVHFDFSSFLNNCNQGANIGLQPSQLNLNQASLDEGRGLQNSEMMKVLQSLFKGMSTGSQNNTTNYQSMIQKDESQVPSLMIKSELADSSTKGKNKARRMKKRISKEESKYHGSPSPNTDVHDLKVEELSISPSLGVSDIQSKNWEKNHDISEDHSVDYNIDLQKEDSLIKNNAPDHENSIGNNLFGIDDKHLNPKKPLFSDFASNKSKEDLLPIDSVSSFSAGEH